MTCGRCGTATLQSRGGSSGSRYRAKLGLVLGGMAGLAFGSPNDVIELAQGRPDGICTVTCPPNNR